MDPNVPNILLPLPVPVHCGADSISDSVAAIDAIDASDADDDNVEMIDEERVCTTEPRHNGRMVSGLFGTFRKRPHKLTN